MSNTPRSAAELRTYHERLLQELFEVGAEAESADMAHQVEVGSVLRDVADAFAEALDKIKERIREHAVRQTGNRTGTCSIAGSDLGEALVTIPEASLRPVRDKPVEEFRQVLGDDLDLFFEEVTTLKPRKEFEREVAALKDSPTKRFLLAAVERVDATPRVGFRRSSNKT